MKKCIFTLCSLAALALPLSAIAQTAISIDATNASTSPKGVETDSLATVKMDTSFAPPVFSALANYPWDMTHMRYSSYRSVSYAAGVNPYQYTDSFAYAVGPISYKVTGNNFFVQQGRIQELQSMMATKDSIKRPHDTAAIAFVAQASYLYGPGNQQVLTNYVKMPFPLTNGAIWGSSYHVTRNFTITETDTSMHIGGSSPAQGKITNFLKETDTVIGYGTMQVNSANLDTAHHYIPSKLIEVLEVKTVKTYHDSVYLPKTFQPRILDSIGIHNYTFNSNGVYVNNTWTTYEICFYTKQLMSPLARVVFTNSSMLVPQSVEVSVGNLSGIDLPVVSVPSLNNSANKISIYPNPVSNGQLFVEVQESMDGNWSYDFINISGQVLSSGPLALSAGTNKAQVSLPAGCAAGMYIIRINNSGKEAVSAPVIVNR